LLFRPASPGSKIIYWVSFMSGKIAGGGIGWSSTVIRGARRRRGSASCCTDIVETAITDFSIPAEDIDNGEAFGDTFTIIPPPSNSPAPFSYSSSDTSIATVDGTTVTILQAGTVTITATQPAYSNYKDGVATFSFTVNKKTPTITNFSIPNQSYATGTFTLPAPTSNSAGAFTYTSSNDSIATVAGSTVTIVQTGTVTITATQAATNNYFAGSTTASFTINPSTPTITNFSIANQTYSSGGTFTITDPSSNSPGAFSYTSSATSVATVAGSVVTMLQAGAVTITATQAATTNYLAGSATASFTIALPPSTTVVYTYTGADQTVTPPAGTTSMLVQAWGAGGASRGLGTIGAFTRNPISSFSGGGGGYTSATFNITPSQQPIVVIVGEGGATSTADGLQTPASYGGGGGVSIGQTNWRTASGGGRSAVRLSGGTDDIITAGGGGGGGTVGGYIGGRVGGSGGGLIGGTSPGINEDGTTNSTTEFAGGGTQSAGGSGSGNINSDFTISGPGSKYQGGTGNNAAGSGGGGGYYGGGASTVGGAGGGSGYTAGTAISPLTMNGDSSGTVANPGALPTGYSSSNVGSGGAGVSGLSGTGARISSVIGNVGQNGLVVITYYT